MDKNEIHVCISLNFVVNLTYMTKTFEEAVITPKTIFDVYLQQLNKRHLRRSRSLVSTLLWGDPEDEDFGKAKNIRQTELLVDLREAILKISRHFQSLDPKNNKVVSKNKYRKTNYLRILLCMYYYF